MGSRGKNFRRRVEEDDSDDRAINGDTGDHHTILPTKPLSKPPPSSATRKKSNQLQAPKLLSFADEEETSVSTEKRDREKPLRSNRSSSSSSHKITSVKDRTSSSTSHSVPSNVQPQSGEYTKEKLKELQKNTRTLASSKTLEPVVVLKGLVKPISLSDQQSENLADSLAESDDIKSNSEPSSRRIEDAGVSTRIRDASDSLIPDQATINAIRAKRERLRQSRIAPDYVSLDGGSNRGSVGGLSDEEPDFHGRFVLPPEDKASNVKQGVFDILNEPKSEVMKGADGEIDEDEDEEDKMWEEEQFRKGLGKRVEDGSNRGATGLPVLPPSSVTSVSQKTLGYGTGYQLIQNLSASGVTRSAEVMSISQQAEVALRALHESTDRLKETHSRTMTSMVRTEENLSASLSNITTLEKSLSAVGEKYIFMQKLRDFISVLCNFLQDKAPFLEELEEQMQKLHEERASSILERRAADIVEESEVEAAVNAAMSVFNKGGAASSVIAAAAEAASSSEREQLNFPVQLDEFGRDMNLQKRMDMKRRSEARKHRNARIELKRMSSIGDGRACQPIEGESSTDESDTETKAYQSHHAELLQTADQIFSDAAEEYSNLSYVKNRFEKWKKLYSSSYRDAYMSLSVPAIFSPYVRLELLKWDPLYEDMDFNDMQWHSLLFDYGLPDDGTDFNPDDADANLIPELVEKVALPILHHDIEHCWDTLSTKETRNAVSATNLVVNYIPATSEALKDLLAAIHARLTNAVANLNVPTWNTLVLKAVPNAARIAAYKFGMSLRLLRNICLWKEILAYTVLEQLALDYLLGEKILPHVRTLIPNIHDAITRTERIVVSMSGVWTGPSVTGGHSQKLQALVDHVMSLGRALEKRHKSVVSGEDEVFGLARRLKKILVDLNEYDKARGILKTFHLKDAL